MNEKERLLNQLEDMQKEFQRMYSCMVDLGEKPKSLSISRVRKVNNVEEISVYQMQLY